MGSTRLAGKVLADIAGRPLLAHVIGRLATATSQVKIVIATGDSDRDDAIPSFATRHGVDCFRGSEEDVLSRFLGCAAQYGFDHIVRLTADNPFTDIEELDRLIELHVGEGFDFTDSLGSLPVGVGAEVFSREALERSGIAGTLPRYREHPDDYILEHRKAFRTGTLVVPECKRRPDVRLTVDTPDDLRRAREIANRARGMWATTEEAIALCSLSV